MSSHSLRRLPVASLVALVVLAGLLLGTPRAAVAEGPAGRWAPAETARIHPGVQMFTRGAQCTANFVFTDDAGRVYVGYAAHCAGRGEATDTDGCRTTSVPTGTVVRFAEGATAVTEGTTVGWGKLVYSSWRTMRRIGTASAAVCAFNDFALVRVNDGWLDRVNPSVPFFGGPTGLDDGRTAAGTRVDSYGNSSLRGGVAVLAPHSGVSLGQYAGGWAHDVYTATPGIPGDSGSGFLDAQGRAMGTLSTVALAPLPGSNGLGDLHRELVFAQRHAGIAGLRLVPGTVPFSG